MRHISRNHCDRSLFAAATALLAVSLVWLALQQPEFRRLREPPVAVSLSGSAYLPVAGLRVSTPSTAVWPKPAAQSHSAGWLYEVFTPPVIYYNPAAKSFAVTPPLCLPDDGPSFPLELLAVKQSEYRLQLVGYFGGPGDYLAAFVSPGHAETLLARAGRRFESLGLKLKSFEVEKVAVDHHDMWPVYDVAALAVLFDEKTGVDVVLDSRARKFTDAPLAVLKLLTDDGRSRELHEGDSFSDDSSTYRIERIQLDPPEVVVARHTPGRPRPETRILYPVAKTDRLMANLPPRVKPFPVLPATGLAHHDQ